MKTLIRDLDSGLLYCSPGEWVENWMQATGFGDMEAAMAFGNTLEKKNLDVYVVDDNGRPAWGQKIEKGGQASEPDPQGATS